MSNLQELRQLAIERLQEKFPAQTIEVVRTTHSERPVGGKIVLDVEITALISNRIYRGVGNSNGKAIDSLIESYNGSPEVEEVVKLK